MIEDDWDEEEDWTIGLPEFTAIPEGMDTFTGLKRALLEHTRKPVAVLFYLDEKHKLYDKKDVRSCVLQLPSNNPNCPQCGSDTILMSSNLNGKWAKYWCCDCETTFMKLLTHVEIVEAEAFL